MSDADKKKRPDRTTMEGIIWSANQVLDAALDPQHKGIPAELFDKCKGVALLSVVTAGFIFSGHGGSGVILAKKANGSWSPPSALGLFGYGFGALAGGEVQDAIIFIMDDETLQDFIQKEQTRMAAKASYTMGKHGRDLEIGDEAPYKGTVSVYFHKGVFADLSIEIGTISHRNAADHKFYGNKASPQQILTVPGAVQIPPDSGIPDLHEKLEILSRGQTKVPSERDVNKSEQLRKEAVEAGEKAKSDEPDIEFVDHSSKSATETTSA